ncbi:hypothetical protein [Aeoliella sp.]|uniref:hypothetical protein n=1 Tax=Aeoliella sp. TaxID=2795800 RepID=UPI003CCBF138
MSNSHVPSESRTRSAFDSTIRSYLWQFGRYRAASLAVPFALVLTQVVTYPLLFFAGVSVHGSPDTLAYHLVTLCASVFFFLPLLTIFGLVLGISSLRFHGAHVLPIIGLLVNFLYLTAFLGLCYLVFVVGITA